MVWDSISSLVTGQVSHCTGEGCASVYLFASYLVEKAVTWTTGRYLGELVYLGMNLGRYMRGQAIYMGVRWVCTWHYVGTHKWGGCGVCEQVLSFHVQLKIDITGIVTLKSCIFISTSC